MTASLEQPLDKRISENIHIEKSLASERSNVRAQHRYSVGEEKDMGSPMVTSTALCDGSIKTLSLTPCDIDSGSSQEVKAEKNRSLSSNGLSFSKEVIDKKKCSPSSSSENISAVSQLTDPSRGSTSKSPERREDNCLDPKLNIPLFFPVSQWSSRYGIQFFSVAVPTVEIIEHPEKGPKYGYAVYTVKVMRGRQVLLRKYRYSQFADFHEKLLISDIAVIIRKGRIHLPSKTLFRNLAAQFLKQRRKGLEKYLHSLLRYKYVPAEAIVQKFLGLNEFVIKDFWIDH